MEQQRQELARSLLVELLSHQMALPVKWIDTQDDMLSDREIERFIELGPSNTLTNMLKKSSASKYRTMDSILDLDRKYIASTKDIAAVRYDYAEQQDQNISAVANLDVRKPVVIAAPHSLPSLPTPVTEVAQESPSQGTLGITLVDSVDDVPVSQLDTVLAIVALKLKKTFAQISTAKTLSELSQGKSALQNELIGDIDAEFESIPTNPENLPLAALAESLPQRLDGEFGKPVSRLLSRWFSTSMPSSLGVKAARDYLRQQWGLEKKRQSAVLLYALANSTVGGGVRLEGAPQGQQHLDNAVKDYSQRHGLNLQIVSSSSASASSGVNATANLDPTMLAELTSKPRRLAEEYKRSLEIYLGTEDSITAKLHKVNDLEQEQELQKQRLDLWLSEFGSDFELGIQPRFTSAQVRHFNFSWNHARLELVKLYHSTISKWGQKTSGREFASSTRTQLRKLADRCDNHALSLTKQLECQADKKYGIESPQAAFSKVISDFVQQSLQRGGPLCHLPELSVATRPVTNISSQGAITCGDTTNLNYQSYPDIVSSTASRIRLLRKDGLYGSEEEAITEKLYESIRNLVNSGVTFSGKTALITGCGQGSIGVEIVKGLLKGGATVVVTSSRDITDAQKFFRPIYAECGARGSELYVLPFNQASVVDCQGLVEYIYDELKLSLDIFIPMAAIPEQNIEVQQLGERSELAHRLMMSNVMRLLGMIIDKSPYAGHMTQVLLPLSPNHGTFGGDGLYSESKLGLESLMERVSSESWGDRISICGVKIGWTRGTGLMAANDMVAEAVESHGALTFTTNQMALNMLALLTPSVSDLWEAEPALADFGGGLKLIPDLKGVITKARENIREKSATLQLIAAEDDLEKASTLSEKPKATTANENTAPTGSLARGRLRMKFPRLPDYNEDLVPLSHLRDMVDPSDTVVIVGFSELGPWGSSRTRWEMESKQMLSLEGYIEMAWIMGLIKHDPKGGWVDANSDKHLEDSQIPVQFGKKILEGSGLRLIHPASAGGYDPAKKELMQEVVVSSDLPPFETNLETGNAFKLKHGDLAIVTKLNNEICEVQIKAGAYIVIPKAVPHPQTTVAGMLPDGWDPRRYGIPDDVINQVDPITLYALICASEAFLSAGIDDPMEVFSHIHVSELGNYVGTSINGFTKYSELFLDTHHDKPVPSDVISEAMCNSPAAWINLLLLGASGPIKTPSGACATALESLDGGAESIRLGKTRMCLVGGVDPFHEYESYAFATLKATVSSDKQFAQGRQPWEMSRPSAETRAGFVDAAGGGALLLCDASLALEMGLPIYGIVAGSGMAADKIGRSVPAPGQGLLTFAREDPDAKTSPLLDIRFRKKEMEVAIGQLQVPNRSPSPSTPFTLFSKASSTDGGEWIKTSASSSSDIGLNTSSSNSSSPRSLKGVSLDDTKVEVPADLAGDHLGSYTLSAISAGDRTFDASLQVQIQNIRRQWSTGIRQLEPGISPIRAALAVWDLDIDDLSIASFHGTSTKANDTNEADTINKQMRHLGRTATPLLVISQKSVTGHGKAPAAAWMLNGCLQALDTGLVPGNYALDNIDPAMINYEHLVYPTETVSVGIDGIKAFLLSSFGFGQKGAQMVGVAPRFFFATLQRAVYEQYVKACNKRKRLAQRAFSRGILEGKVVKVHDKPPYKPEEESEILLDPRRRARRSFEGEVTFTY